MSPLLADQCRPSPGLSLHWGPEKEAAKSGPWPAGQELGPWGSPDTAWCQLEARAAGDLRAAVWGPEAAPQQGCPQVGSRGGGSRRAPGKAEAWLQSGAMCSLPPTGPGERVPPASGLERPAPLLTSCLILTFTELLLGFISVSVQFGYHWLFCGVITKFK